MPLKVLGIIIILIGIIFNFAETAYFGFNWFAKTTAESMCDGFSLSLCVLGYYSIWLGRDKKDKWNI